MGPGGRERGRESRVPTDSCQSCSDKIGKGGALSESRRPLATRLDNTAALGTGHLQCGVSPSRTAEPQDSVSRPSFVQLTQAGPSLSPADSKAGSQEVTGHGRAPRPGAHKAGAGLPLATRSSWEVVPCSCQWASVSLRKYWESKTVNMLGIYRVQLGYEKENFFICHFRKTSGPERELRASFPPSLLRLHYRGL